MALYQLQHLTTTTTIIAQLQNSAMFLEWPQWQALRWETHHAGRASIGTFHLEQFLMSAGRWMSKVNASCSESHRLLAQRMGGVWASTLYFGSLHSIFNRQTDRNFFPLLRKTFTKLKGNQNSNLTNENKTMQQAR